MKKRSKNKKGFELAISTLILIVLGILVLIALILAFTGGWQKFLNTIKGYSGSEIDSVVKICQNQCSMEQSYSFCCEDKQLKGEKIKCLDDRLDVECEINCENVCS